jgi:hypothetical protein
MEHADAALATPETTVTHKGDSMLKLCDGLIVQPAHDHYVVLDANHQQVLNASGPAAEVLGHVLDATPVPGHLSDAVAMLTQLHVVAAPDHVSRRHVLRSGVTAAAVGVVVLTLPTAAAASSAGVAAPGGVEAVAGDQLVIVSWQAVPGASSYQVYFRVNGSGAAFAPAAGEAATATSWRATGLTNNTPYDFHVVAISGATQSAPSAEATATPRSFAVESALALPSGAGFPQTAITDGTHAYFGLRDGPGRVVKVKLSDMTNAGTLDVGGNEFGGYRSSISDGTYGYFGRASSPGRIDRITLSTLTAAPAPASLTLEAGENSLLTAITDGTHGYFSTNTSPGQVVKVNLSTMTRVGAVTLEAGENVPVSAVLSGGFGYFGTNTNPGRVVKVNLSTMIRVGAVTLDTNEGNLESAVTDGAFGYFGTTLGTRKIVKVDLTNMLRVSAVAPPDIGSLYSAVISGAYGYFGSLQTPGKVAKVHLATMTVVGVLNLASGQNELRSAVASDGFGYFGTLTDPGRVVKITLGS